MTNSVVRILGVIFAVYFFAHCLEPMMPEIMYDYAMYTCSACTLIMTIVILFREAEHEMRENSKA